ncbi:MAG: porphobilinogen synthase [Cyclobacteriaceae bacterium]
MLNTQRPRRNRTTFATRELVAETTISLNDFIFPLFLIEGSNQKIEIDSMPGIFRYSLDLLVEEIQECLDLGIKGFALFPAISEEKKDRFASEGMNPEGLYLTALKTIHERFTDIFLLTDIAMDPYSSDGHDGLVEDDNILNDETLEILGHMALAQAKAGAKLLGPSDMMDGRVGYIRKVLDKNGFTDVAIMSYSAKYASSFYGPFRDALDSSPKSGDKKTYQMDYRNSTEALLEAELDTQEGADFLMVKPALAYLDIIHILKQNSTLPIAAYNISGEYAMVKAAAEKGWIDGEQAMIEILTSIKRAGADIILTYFAKEYALMIRQ